MLYLIHRWDLTGTNTSGQSRLRSNSNKKLLHIPQKPPDSRLIIWCSLVSYLGYSFEKGLTLCRDAVVLFYNLIILSARTVEYTDASLQGIGLTQRASCGQVSKSCRILRRFSARNRTHRTSVLWPSQLGL